MERSTMVAGVFALGLCSGAAYAQAPHGVLATRIVEGDGLHPIEGATVIVRSGGVAPVVFSGATDEEGWLRLDVPSGQYSILAVYGDARWYHGGLVVDDHGVTEVPGVLAVDPEVVTILEHVPPTQKPQQAKVRRNTVKKILPYSDEAIDSEVWGVGWVLLDVDERGVVTAFRWLNRPGHGLDAIAEHELFRLEFEPARDQLGRAVASKVLWKVEWPPYLYARNVRGYNGSGPNSLLPALVWDNYHGFRDYLSQAKKKMLPTPIGSITSLTEGFILPGGTSLPPCKDNGPLNLENNEILYRDCTGPDLSKLSTSAPIVRPRER